MLSDDISTMKSLSSGQRSRVCFSAWMLMTRPAAIRVTRWKLYWIRSVQPIAMMCTVYVSPMSRLSM